MDLVKTQNTVGSLGGLSQPPSLDRVSGGAANGLAPGSTTANKSLGPQFGDLLKEKIGSPEASILSQKNGVKFSNHAIERMQSRGIRFTPEHMERLNGAIEKAEQKGSKDTLVLMDNAALIVNVKNKTVVTAIDRNLMKDNVFTNIDSTIMI